MLTLQKFLFSKTSVNEYLVKPCTQLLEPIKETCLNFAVRNSRAAQPLEVKITGCISLIIIYQNKISNICMEICLLIN